MRRENITSSLLLLSLSLSLSSTSILSLGDAVTLDTTDNYKLWEPSLIVSTLKEWENGRYKSLVQLNTAQELYNLDRAGKKQDCPFDKGGDGCLNYILTIQDTTLHPIGSDSSNRLPEVFWSGAVHGDERVGPTAVMEASNLLLESAWCESISTPAALASSCRRSLLEKHGITDGNRQWLARLVTTRRIVVIPTANAVGYYRNQRADEHRIDPNRDFPFDLTDPKMCMRTIAGRVINEVMRQHMFQLGLTFHGGMEVVAYEWGAPSYYRKQSPDDTAQAMIANAYSRFGAGWTKSHPYDVGTMNDKVYYVRGGMEDWAYAGSWLPNLVLPCEPATYSPYDKARTIYNDGTLRVFNMLVETSNRKEPIPSMLGNSKEVLNENYIAGNGHISRNVRLALLSAELVQPYVRIVVVNDLILSDDIVPLQVKHPSQPSRVMIPKYSTMITVEWTVGGAFNIDSTELWVSSSPSNLDATTTFRSQEEAEGNGFQKLQQQEGGNGYFSIHGPKPHPSTSQSDDGEKNIMGPIFTTTLDVSNLASPGDSVMVVASARVDASWSTNRFSHDRIGPDVPPQSHIVNARTNTSWYYEQDKEEDATSSHIGEKSIIQGQLDWFSIPLMIVVGAYDDSIGQTPSGKAITTIEVPKRFGTDDKNVLLNGGVKPKHEPKKRDYPMLFGISFFVLSVIVVFIIKTKRQIKREEEFSNFLNDNDDAVELQIYPVDSAVA